MEGKEIYGIPPLVILGFAAGLTGTLIVLLLVVAFVLFGG